MTPRKMAHRSLLRENENQIFITDEVQFVPRLALDKTGVFGLPQLSIELFNGPFGFTDLRRESFIIPVKPPQAPQKTIHDQGCREKNQTKGGHFSRMVEKIAKRYGYFTN